METCKDCNGKGLRGANGTTVEQIGRLVTCVACEGTGHGPNVYGEKEMHEEVPQDEDHGGDTPVDNTVVDTPKKGILEAVKDAILG